MQGYDYVSYETFGRRFFEVAVTEERVGVNTFVLEVSDLSQLQATMRAIQKVDGVVGVERVKSL